MADENRAATTTASLTHRVRRWRRVHGIGGLLLAVSFFLPAVRSCNSQVVPAREALTMVTDSGFDFEGRVAGFLLYVAAYLFGLLAFILAVRGYRLRREADRTLGVSIAVLLGVVIVTVLVCLVIQLIDSGFGCVWSWGSGLFIALVLASCAYWFRSVRMGPAGLLCLRWYGSLLCLLWFGTWLVTSPKETLYGLWLSVLGVILMMVGACGEATARGHRTIRRTLARLFTCRVKFVDVTAPAAGPASTC